MIHNSFLHDLFIMFVLLFTIYFLDGILDNSYMYDLFLYYFGVVDQDINDMSYNDLFHVLVQTLLLLIFIVAVNFLNVYGIWTHSNTNSVVVVLFAIVFICLLLTFVYN